MVLVKYTPKEAHVRVVPAATGGARLVPGINEVADAAWEAMMPHLAREIEGGTVRAFGADSTPNGAPADVAARIVAGCADAARIREWLEQGLSGEAARLALARVRLLDGGAAEGAPADLSDYYRKGEVDARIAQAKGSASVDLSNYYTKADVDGKISALGAGSGAPKAYEKFVVIGVWGQSNAVGYDESLLTKYDVPRDAARVFQFSDRLKPLTYCAENLQNMNTVEARNSDRTAMRSARANESEARKQYCMTKGIHLPLANLVLDAIPDDYGVIIVPAAFGGRAIASFVKGQQYYTQFIQRMKGAMESGANKADNILAGIVWCQGENNCGNTNGENYKNTFNQLVTDVNTELAAYASRTTRGTLTINDWYFYEWPVFYKQRDTQGILAAMKTLLGSRYVPIPDDTPHNETNYTSGDKGAHFAGNSFRTVIAPRVFAAMRANGAFLVNEYDADTVAASADTSAIDAKIAALEAKVAALTPKAWRAPTEQDFEWLNNATKNNGTYANGAFHFGNGANSSGIIFKDGVEQIRFKVAAGSAQPALAIVTFRDDTGAHNSVFAGGSNFLSNGKFWPADGRGDSFSGGLPRDEDIPLATLLANTAKGTLITLERVDATHVKATVGEQSETLDVAARSKYKAGTTVRFGFSSLWTGSSYDVSDVEVYA